MASSNTKRVGRDLTEGPIFSTLVIFALPIILTNVIQQLYGMVDLAVAGSGFATLGFAIGLLDGVICKIGLSLAYFLGIACLRILPGLLCFAYTTPACR